MFRKSAKCVSCEDETAVIPLLPNTKQDSALVLPGLDDTDAIKALIEDVMNSHDDEKLQALLEAYSPYLLPSATLADVANSDNLPDLGLTSPTDTKAAAAENASFPWNITSYLDSESGVVDAK